MTHIPVLCTLTFMSTFIFAVSGQLRSTSPECHLRRIDECIKPLFYFSHRPNTTGLAITRRDHSILCRSLKNLASCIGNYMSKCGTPLYQSLFNNLIEIYMNTVRPLCVNGPIKQNYLDHASCLNSHVKATPEYRRKCVNRFQATLESIDPLQDDRVGAACCAYKWWLDCSLGMVSKKCTPSNDAVAAYYDYTNILSAGVLEGLCKPRKYAASSKYCGRIISSSRKRAKGRNSNNVFSKYFSLILPNLGF